MDSIESKFSSTSSDSYVSQNSSDLAIQQTKIRLEQVDQRLCCPVCLERFSDPRLLECNHSFCRNCLLDVITKRPRNPDEDDEDGKGDRELYCPKCRKVTLLDEHGVDALPMNYALKDIVEAMPEDASTFSPSTPVTMYGHSLAVPTPICQIHQRQMEHFCKTDDQLLCGVCITMECHRGHVLVLAKEVLNTELEQIRQTSFESAERMLLKVRESVDSVANMADALREKGEKTKSQIQEHFKEIRDALEAREQSLLNTTEEIIMRKVAKLDLQKEVLTKSRDDLNVQVLKLKHILANRDDYSFLRDKKKFLLDVEQVVELAQSKDRTPVESTKDGPDYFLSDDLLSRARNFGEVYCKPCPSKFTARGEGLSKAFINKKAEFRVEARDRYGQRSIVSGTTIKAIIQGPQRTTLPSTIEEVSKGEYIVTYTPAHIGYHLIRVTADRVKISNGDSHAVVYNKRDYSSLSMPKKFIPKNNLKVEPPVSTMRSVCTLPTGDIVFTDAFCLRVVNPKNGQLIRTIGSYGTAQNQFSLPVGLSVNRQGHIFVSDSTNHRIEKFTSEGRHLITFGTAGQRPGNLAYPEGLAVLGEEKLYVADCGNNRIQIFSQRNGKFQGGFGKKGSNAGEFVSPRDLAVDSRNNRILVSDTENYRIQALSYDGKPLLQFGNPKGGSVYLHHPFFITVDEDGFILITETRSHYVTILTPRGVMVRHLGSQGNSVGQFKTPYGICVDSESGSVIVTDSTSHCIQIF